MIDFDWLFFLEVSLAGLGSGALLALTGLSFVLIYKATRAVNLAIGEMLMIGAYAFFSFSAGLGLPWWAAVPAALACGGLLGAVIERAVIRPMLGESAISVLMVTIGLGSVLIGAVELLWGADPAQLPDFMGTSPVFLGPAYVSRKIVIGFAVAATVITLFILAFRFWRGGVALRATATDQGAAYSCGIDVPVVFSMAWVFAGVAAAGAGILVGAVGGISPAMGIFGLSALVVVIVGGLDSVVGALIGGVLVGLIEAWTGTYLGGEFKTLITFGLLIAVLMVRPYGLFGTVEIERL
ncbi:branched-chain amino acid ABC transporter permease [Pinisolibacter aquiterrae]|uniref:branched-chain amino acid ABC transporter permease n=1 Tax=Pinisolibacter aquiterrae TaxID=2815579 RepID=UPI001C3D03E7|nr:branched-chain amino acid ABC transporter permease [Pinisolibacter aquiterrae]MBV5265438.1 branched-chain amino acid ABC transporter permease [Pinisolibacter aquiterrae]MCC8236071.1 branched-chain amino acid ABC transporter permease [Pinisolibacter aquiterrae]